MALRFRKRIFQLTVLMFFSLLATPLAFGQAKQSDVEPKPPAPKTIFRNSDGDLISNDEFVDIRMANFHYPDHTLVKTLEDGTTEFRLQKVPQEGAPIPPLAFTTLDGRNFSPRDLSGKVLVVNFWFVGCPACVYEMPKLNEMAAKFAGRDDIVFVSMSSDPADKTRKYLQKEKFDYQTVADALPLMKTLVFGGYPKNFVVGKDGRIVYWRSTIHAWWKFESVIREELAR